MRKLRLIAILAALSMLVLLLGAPSAGANQERTYEVTIENLTNGQPLTPGLLAPHTGNDGFFEVGEAASFGIKEIAENGNLEPLIGHITADRSFDDHAVLSVGSPPPILPGEKAEGLIFTAPPFNFVSWASMLICTNDGFTGVNKLKLPERVGQTITVRTAAYDAGTEVNTEDFADMVPPCPVLTGVDSDDAGTGMSDPTLAEGGVIHHHLGVAGIADLVPEIHDWANPVAEIVITRTD